MNRFREPTGNDDYAHCQHCNGRFHYTALDDNGECEECAALREEIDSIED